MDRQHEDRMDRLEARCIRLERANNRLKRGGLVLVGILALGVTIGFRALDKPQPWEGASLTVVDEEGSKLAWVGKEKGYGRIKLFNQAGEVFWATPPFKRLKLDKDIPRDTRDKIDQMSIEEAMAALSKNADTRRLGNLDEETAARLRKEFKLLMLRLRALKRVGK